MVDISYIIKMKKYKKDKKTVYMIFDRDCKVCDMQVDFFKKKLKVNFDDSDNKGNRDRIVGRIYPIERDSSEYKKLKIDEITGKDEFYPSFISIKKRELLSFGFIGLNALKHVTKSR